LLVSSKIAAASARQKSTSMPLQILSSDCAEKPITPCLTPHATRPRSLTPFSVCDDAAALANKAQPSTETKASGCSAPRAATRPIRPSPCPQGLHLMLASNQGGGATIPWAFGLGGVDGLRGPPTCARH